MKPLSYVIFFVVVLVISTTFSFVGYRYLALANDYRKANFVHLHSVYSAIDLMRQQPVPTSDDLQRLVGLIEAANAEAIWCIENLNIIDNVMIHALGASDALLVCENGIKTGNATLEILAELTDKKGQGLNSATSMSFVLYSKIFNEIERLRDLSVSFQPYVDRIQAQLEVLVKTGTAVVSFLLVLLSTTVARQLVRAQERIRSQSLTDVLTGLQNRRGMDLALAERDDESEVILARIDLDRFKQVNDILGHDAGDFVLMKVADFMSEHAGKQDTLARIGGDEFVILFEKGTTLTDAHAVVENILTAVAQPLMFGDKQCKFGASIGLASSAVDGLSVKELLNGADNALYEVKRTGRGTISTYSAHMHQDAIRERALADRLLTAIQEHEIIPYFQSQHRASDWGLTGIEVLARWDHPELGILSPDKFLGIARQLGVEADIDRIIFEQTVSIVTANEAKGVSVPRVAFNVSAGRLMDTTFLTHIRDGIPKHREKFAFEILESVSYEEHGEQVSFTIEAIKEMGFQVDVDDFGSGHASINSVLNISPHVLKIDRNIIRPIAESDSAYQMAASIVQLAKALDVELIAEGVDTLEKAELLREMGCHMLQGFLFSKPMPAHDLEIFIQAPLNRPSDDVAALTG